MREKIMEYFLIKYLRTFPPISKNGNSAFGEFKRQMLMIPINLVGGKHTEDLVKKITKRWILTT